MVKISGLPSILSLCMVFIVATSADVLKRCFVCRSRGDLGSCKDPFIYKNSSEPESGVQVVPCASGWCGKVLETENPLKEEYGVATQRLCFQRGPSDHEDRCAYTKYNNNRVWLCLCKGDLCNSSSTFKISFLLFVFSIFLTFKSISTVFTDIQTIY